MKNSLVKVVFRMFRGDVVALFPQLPGTNDPSTCTSYEHVGQHGSADVSGVVLGSRLATRAEFTPLAKELRRLGYKLTIRKRCTWSDYEKRKAEIARISQPVQTAQTSATPTNAS